FAQPQHLSAEQVLSALQTRNAGVSKATVYNTLNLYAAKGLVRQMVIDPDRIFFDSNTAAHYHFYNEDTGELKDLDASQLEIRGLPELPQNTVKCGVDVIIHLRNK
ncbi:MAG: Fe2+/Zn2+ uptake regulation protein, partial [Gammaproteobacteria bacterium]|nr:Fe2+/Zn2+ uptake regulation protein [Gammaproteobacteria bacterium]